MSEKRTEQIGIRITPETKKILEEEAKKMDWAPAKLAEKILKEWTQSTKKNGGAINFIIENNDTININQQ